LKIVSRQVYCIMTRESFLTNKTAVKDVKLL
jgi:hypothetical protein